MNRRTFVRTLALMTAATAVAPAVARKYFFAPDGGWIGPRPVLWEIGPLDYISMTSEFYTGIPFHYAVIENITPYCGLAGLDLRREKAVMVD